jgi:prepilin-type N-terminal cleavage/methylation domain-containing protein
MKGNMTSRPASSPSPRRAAFTLVEILIVVVILGILAAIAVPKLSNASQIARENTLRDCVSFLRTQIQVYHSQHMDIFPGYPAGDTTTTPTATDFVNQLTLFTDAAGNTSAAGTGLFVFGPYLSQMPSNPVNTLITVKILAAGDPLAPDGTTGWLYQPSTGQLLPNVMGSDSSGNDYTSY